MNGPSTRGDAAADSRGGVPTRPLTLQNLLDRGLPYARIDRWARAKHLHPQHDGGTGNPRTWPQRELEVAAIMWALVEGGLAAGVAAIMARGAVDTRQPVRLARGITLHVDVDQLTGGTP